ncbi:hypothetical protein [Vibrio diabolicus]|uniref:hypothetical protein n=1 Tax=Vibrio diabolicus TaxID=50719 RepID=UPI00211AA616|nr:hypothetical protein [Vibrio diabolicus]MCG6222715.1 hypothetical protein [Vibrio diabolicus]
MSNQKKSPKQKYFDHISQARSHAYGKIASVLLAGVILTVCMELFFQMLNNESTVDSANSTKSMLLKTYKRDIESGFLDAEYCATKEAVPYKDMYCKSAFKKLVKYKDKRFVNSRVEENMDHNYMLFVYKHELRKARNETVQLQKSILTKFPFSLVTDPYYQVKEVGFAFNLVWLFFAFPILLFVHIYMLYFSTITTEES